MVSSSDITTEDKCQCLLRDSSDNWIYSEDGETSAMKYIVNLQKPLPIVYFVCSSLFFLYFHSHRLYAVLIILYLKFTIYASLEEERDALKSSIDKLQNNLQMVNVLKQERKGVAN
jgi:hypothetical protein